MKRQIEEEWIGQYCMQFSYGGVMFTNIQRVDVNHSHGNLEATPRVQVKQSILQSNDVINIANRV